MHCGWGTGKRARCQRVSVESSGAGKVRPVQTRWPDGRDLEFLSGIRVMEVDPLFLALGESELRRWRVDLV